ncbi:hypothetical protein N9199_01995 [bacterium]|nr:hypothetical protein [bacterium]
MDWVGTSMGPDGLDLRKVSGLLVIYIIRAQAEANEDSVVTCPGRDTVFRDGDWVYLARGPSKATLHQLDMTVLGVKTQILQDYSSNCDMAYHQNWPEFDEFDFPETCVGGYIILRVGERFLDLRRKFLINLVAIKRKTDGKLIRVIGPAELDQNVKIEQGDVGVVIRVPDGKSGFSRRVLTRASLDRLAEIGCDEF